MIHRLDGNTPGDRFNNRRDHYDIVRDLPSAIDAAMYRFEVGRSRFEQEAGQLLAHPRGIEPREAPAPMPRATAARKRPRVALNRRSRAAARAPPS